MTRKTVDTVATEIKYIKEILENEFKLNRIAHERIIEKQNITNGNIIRHDDRLNNVENEQVKHRKNHHDCAQNRKQWIFWIPHVIIAVIAVVNVYAQFK